MRNKKDSKNPESYIGFGTSVKETDPNILYSVARSFYQKTGGLCLASELEALTIPTEIEKRLKEFNQKTEIDVFTHPKVKEILRNIVNTKFHTVIEVMGGNHVAIFYPLPYFRLETINKVFADSDKFSDVSLHWITLR
jgi:hypothetical protein